MRNKYDVVQLLIAYSANVTAVDFQGRTAMHCAARHGASEVLEVLSHVSFVLQPTVWCLFICLMRSTNCSEVVEGWNRALGTNLALTSPKPATLTNCDLWLLALLDLHLSFDFIGAVYLMFSDDTT